MPIVASLEEEAEVEVQFEEEGFSVALDQKRGRERQAYTSMRAG